MPLTARSVVSAGRAFSAVGHRVHTFHTDSSARITTPVPASRTMASTSIPKTMKAVQVSKTGGPEVLDYRTDMPVPQPGEGQLMVKNAYVGLNFIDVYFRTGLYPSPKPEILGREAEGTVVSLGPGTTGFSVGDRVVWLGTGAYAQYSAAPAVKAVKVPEGVPEGHAAAALLQGLTALTLIHEAYAVQKGDWILVQAAAGGVGLWLCQLLKDVGARTIGTASSAAKLQLARDNGAGWEIDYSHEDVVARVKEITGGEGVRAVFDGVGKSTFETDLEVLARKGSLISFGNASGAVPPLAISRLSAKNLKLARPKLDAYIATREEFEHYTKELFRVMLYDKMNVRVHDIYPLEDVARAQQDLEERKTTGKVLLKP